MTRARETLTLLRMRSGRSGDLEARDRHGGLHVAEGFRNDDAAHLAHRDGAFLEPAPPELDRRYRTLGLADVDLGYAGRRHARHPVHHAIASLGPGDPLNVHESQEGWLLVTDGGTVVGRLAKSFAPPDAERLAARVYAVATWSREASEPEFRSGYRCDEWEVVVPELVFDGN